MLLLEHEGKALLRTHDIRTPEGRVILRESDVDLAITEISGPYIVKAQVPIGGRGKAGGIKIADTAADAQRAAASLLGLEIKGHAVETLLIESRQPVREERYLAFVLDGADTRLLFGCHGGIDVEASFEAPQAMFRSMNIDPLLRLHSYQVRNLLDGLAIDRVLWPAYSQIAESLYRLFRTNDATLAEINPLAETADGRLVALDARIIVDDGAFFRHPEFKAIERGRLKGDGLLARLKELEIQYVPIGGTVGLISSGAGVGVTVMDWLQQEGAQLSAFVDLDYAIINGNTQTGIRLMLDTFCDDPTIQVIIINFTTCGLRLDEIARSLLAAIAERTGPLKPLYFHLEGNRSAAAHALLKDAGYEVVACLGEAVRSAARVAKAARQ